MTHHWHRLSSSDSLGNLEVDAEQGLSHAEARRRFEQHGANEIVSRQRRGVLALLADQFKDFMILVLLAAAVVAGLVGDLADTVTILVIVLLNAGIGFSQSWRADRAIHALRRLAAPTAKVRREGREHPVPASAIVPGDIVVMEAGDLVPADLRLLEAAQFHSDESALTGESLPVEKSVHALAGEHPLAERSNMAYKGTLAVRGRARGLAVATGMHTELGRVASLLDRQDELHTPLQRKLERFGRQISVAVIAIAALVFAAGMLRGEPPLPMLLFALSLAVAAIPEALPAVLTMALSLGAARMARHHALVRQLPAVETLGSVTRICSDKTGTLTLNRMQVAQVYCGGEARERIGDDEPGRALARAMLLNGDVRAGSSGLLGDPTEIALVEAAGLEPAAVQAQWPRVAELPFDSERKRMLTVHRGPEGRLLALLKGAPEAVLPRCRDALGMALEPAQLAAEVERMALLGARVLAFAQCELPALPARLEDAEQGLCFIGFTALLDPPRAEAAAAVQAARTAGIETVMVTGDHPQTAAAIAAKVGISTAGGVLSGLQLERLSAAALQAAVAEVRVFARVSPEQKIAIVEALRACGEIVAVTGDGVNDAPALKAADIGVAMGRNGTDVARESADLVLLDDNFATIITAVREGRRIYDNIRKFVKYAVTTNTAELLILLLAPLLGLPLPLLPIQILWINLVSDGLPGLALASDPASRTVMARPPRRPGESLFARGLGAHVVWMGLFLAALALLTQAWALQGGIAEAQTMVFTVMTFTQMAQVLSIRAGWQSVLGRELWRNPWLLAAVALTLLAQLGVVYLPWANAVFSTVPLSAAHLALCFGAAALVFAANEIEKLLVRAGLLYGGASR